MNNAGRAGLDVPASEVISDDLRYGGVVQSWIGPMDAGVDFKDMSTRDYYEMAGGTGYMVKEGHGAMVSQLAMGLPIKLNTSVTHIDYSGKGVSVETTKGTISAKTCLITVSTGVLAAEKISFNPPLPPEKQQAINDVPMGLLVKIPLQFNDTKFGLNANNWLTYDIPNNVPAQACYFLSWPFNFNLMIGFIGGEFGWEVSKAGPAPGVDFALNELVKIFGSEVRKKFIKGHMTDWATNPLTLGAYGAVKPGKFEARNNIAEPMADRVFFAGEALAGDMVTLCGGAYRSGKRAARVMRHVL